ncbi:MAG TPA: M23 family metallopeptidase [Bacillota bacterium]|nr:M23 family metallopeptidase [Bacillota bacterium]
MSEEQKQPIQPPKSSGKGFFSKKWTFPVMYMGAAALILAFIVWYQDSQNLSFEKKDLMPEVSKGQSQVTTNNTASPAPIQEAVAVNGQNTVLAWPAATEANVNMIMHYYDDNAADDVKAAALVKYEDSYWPHTGIDLATKDSKVFDIKAAGAGKVTKAEKDPMVGNIVEIEHAGGLTTIYQSLDDLKVKVGDEVKQGDVLGKAGRNLFEKSVGAHLHFEVKENGKSVSPEKYFNQKQAQ